MTSPETPRRLYKDPDNEMIDGVCAGLAKYFGMDPTIVRLIFVVLGLAGFSGVALYIIMMIVVPDEPRDGSPQSPAA